MQLLVLVGKEERRRPVAVLVICPLIIDHQIGEAEGFGNQSSRYRSPQIIWDLASSNCSDWPRLGTRTTVFPLGQRMGTSCRSVLALKMFTTHTFISGARWLDKIARRGFRRTIGCLQTLFPLPPPPLPRVPLQSKRHVNTSHTKANAWRELNWPVNKTSPRVLAASTERKQTIRGITDTVARWKAMRLLYRYWFGVAVPCLLQVDPQVMQISSNTALISKIVNQQDKKTSRIAPGTKIMLVARMQRSSLPSVN